MVPPFENQAVVLTGASSGIGRELALQLADQGARLALAARSRDALEEVAAACRARGAEALVVVTDVTDEAQCRRLVKAAVDAFGGLDMLIANAGVTMWGRFDELETLDFFETLLRVNYLGAVYCTRYALPHLKRSGGRLVAVSSMTGKTGVPTRTGYAASKHAMVGFFDSLRVELRMDEPPSGVTITVACPDFVATPTRERGFGVDGRPVGESPADEGAMMSAAECARQILVGATRRYRELIMSRRGRLGLWLKVLAPDLVDRIAARAIRRGR
ncbi:MAG: SDR family oxidoreductase [Acidobacteriota bacterium]